MTNETATSIALKDTIYRRLNVLKFNLSHSRKEKITFSELVAELLDEYPDSEEVVIRWISGTQKLPTTI